MLYETAARASEVLALDVGDLDRPQRRARVVSKGGNTDMVYWASPTARLVARYLAGRNIGPLFLTTDRSRNPSSRRDVYAPTGQARLAYRTAAALFGRHSGGWTLHQLRHSSLTHLAEGGASAVMLQAKSRHRDLRWDSGGLRVPARSRSRRPAHRRPVRQGLSAAAAPGWWSGGHAGVWLLDWCYFLRGGHPAVLLSMLIFPRSYQANPACGGIALGGIGNRPRSDDTAGMVGARQTPEPLRRRRSQTPLSWKPSTGGSVGRGLGTDDT